MARKARKRRFEEARALKRGFDDGLFTEGDRTLADIDDDAVRAVHRDDVPETQHRADDLPADYPPSDCVPNGSGDA